MTMAAGADTTSNLSGKPNQDLCTLESTATQGITLFHPFFVASVCFISFVR